MSTPILPPDGISPIIYPSPTWNSDILSDVVPFTRRNTYTFLLKFEELVAFVNETVKTLDDNDKALLKAWLTQSEYLVGEVHRVINDTINYIEDPDGPVVQAVVDAAMVLINDSALVEAILNQARAEFATKAELQAHSAQNQADLLIILQELSGRLGNASLDARYLAYAIWDGTKYVIPDPRPARLIFLGPVDPGLTAAPGDYWAIPNLVTMADVAAAMRDKSSDLYKATVSTAAGEYVPLDLYTMSASVEMVTLNQGTNNEIIAYKLGEGSGVPGVYGRCIVPIGWNDARPVFWWFATAGENVGNVRWLVRSVAMTGKIDSGLEPWQSSQPVGVIGTINETEVPTPSPIVAGKPYSVRIGRNGTSSTDTFEGDVYLTFAALHRIG